MKHLLGISMGLFSRNKPKIKEETVKKDSFSGWIKCDKCAELIHAQELEKNLRCCPKCDHHYPLCVKDRIELLTDLNSFKELFSHLKPVDSLKFVDSESYVKRIKRAQKNSPSDEAICVGTCTIEGKETALGVMDFSYMGGSMGSVVGERITLLIEYAIEHKLPVVLVTASGGARMQEAILSLMQMAKTAAALSKLHDARLPYISILTHPTTGGVTASFASLGDIIIAEPDALIAFAGPRVVEQTIGEKLPPGAQRSEFLLERGMIDIIVKRKELKKKLSFFVNFFTENISSSTSRKSFDERLSSKLQELLRISENFEAIKK